MLLNKKYAWDDFFDFNLFNNEKMMKTNIFEKENGYTLEIEIPGYKKEDISISVWNGYLTVEVSGQEEKDYSKIICSERYLGDMQRSFYLGENIVEDNVKAVLEDGILKINLKKDNGGLVSRKVIEID